MNRNSHPSGGRSTIDLSTYPRSVRIPFVILSWFMSNGPLEDRPTTATSTRRLMIYTALASSAPNAVVTSLYYEYGAVTSAQMNVANANPLFQSENIGKVPWLLNNEYFSYSNLNLSTYHKQLVSMQYLPS